MSTVTAHILAGREHLYHGGINPTHHIALYENSRPVLMVDAFMPEEGKETKLPRWIPSLDNMVDDIMLMAAVFIFKDQRTIEMLEEAVPETTDWREWMELYDIDETVRLKLYAHVKSLSFNCKMVFTVMEDSHLVRQMGKVKEYPFAIEVFVADVE